MINERFEKKKKNSIFLYGLFESWVIAKNKMVKYVLLSWMGKLSDPEAYAEPVHPLLKEWIKVECHSEPTDFTPLNTKSGGKLNLVLQLETKSSRETTRISGKLSIVHIKQSKWRWYFHESVSFVSMILCHRSFHCYALLITIQYFKNYLEWLQ